MSEDIKPLSPTFIGLDMSLSATGFCRKQGKDMLIETIKTNPRTCVNDLARLRYISDKCMERIPKDTSMICMEDYFVGRFAASGLKLAALGAVIRLALYETGLPFFIITPSQLKKYITGKGNSPKSMVIKEVYKKWKIDCKDDNQADATVLAHVSEAVFCNLHPDSSLVLPYKMLKYQTDTLKKVIDERPHYNIKM